MGKPTKPNKPMSIGKIAFRETAAYFMEAAGFLD
jgi:hypothetical protein